MHATGFVSLLGPMDDLLEWMYTSLYAGYEPIVESVLQESVFTLAPAYENFTDVRDTIRVLVMAVYVAFVVVGGVVVMTYETVQTRYSLREIAPRLVLGLMLAWLGDLIVTEIITFNHDVVKALLYVEEGSIDSDAFLDDFPPNDAAMAMFQMMANKGADFSLMSIIGLVLKLIAVVVLWVSQILRTIAWYACIMVSPAALACHGLPFTENLAKLWWRIVGACLASSIGQAAVMFVWVQLWWSDANMGADKSGDPDYGDQVVYCLIAIWAMWKIHSAAFAAARGRPVRFPGSRVAKVAAGMAAWRVVNRSGRRRRAIGETTGSPSGPASSRRRFSIRGPRNAPVTGAPGGAADAGLETSTRGTSWPPAPASDSIPSKAPKAPRLLRPGAGDVTRTSKSQGTQAPGRTQDGSAEGRSTGTRQGVQVPPPPSGPAAGKNTNPPSSGSKPRPTPPPPSLPPIRLRPPTPPPRRPSGRDSRKDDDDA